MTNQGNDSEKPSPTGIIIAAGGILAKKTPQGVKIAVIHRPKYDDWCLPKGKINEKEAIREAAEREVYEETKCKAKITALAGTSAYYVDKMLKTVWYFHMDLVHEDKFVEGKEVDDLLWLTPEDALEKLTHKEERDLVAKLARTVPKRPGFFVRLCRAVAGSDLRGERLKGSIKTYRIELQGKCMAAGNDTQKLAWFGRGLELLDSAEYFLRNNKIDVGWQCFHAALRLEVFTMDGTTLASKAQNLLQESGKIREWRKKAVEKILEKPEGKENEFEQKQVFEAMLLIHEHYNNVYYKIGLFRRQLTILAVAFGFLILLILGLAIACLIPPLGSGNKQQSDLIVGVIILGILGGAMSSFFSIIRTSKESTVPDQVASGPVTTMRVLVGAASALAVFVLVHSALFETIFNFTVESKATMLFLAFVSGYSERFVQKAVVKISGEK